MIQKNYALLVKTARTHIRLIKGVRFVITFIVTMEKVARHISQLKIQIQTLRTSENNPSFFFYENLTERSQTDVSF